MKRLLLALAASALLCLPSASAAKPPTTFHKAAGPCNGRAFCSGRTVKGIQWLLGGHRPSVYTKTAPTFKARPNGLYGARTAAAVKAMKFRIGYPQKGQCGATVNEVTDTASTYFIQLLEGRRSRPRCWVGVAAERIKGVVVPGATRTALAIKKLELSQLGVHEVPSGSNRGPRISYASGGYGPYQGSTGAYGLAWCASFANWALIRITGDGFGSSNDAYVPAIVEHAQALGWLQAKPRVGSFAAFLTSSGRLASAYHIGFVIKLVGSSGVMTIEGNAGNLWGGMVREVYRRYALYHMIYVNKPGVA